MSSHNRWKTDLTVRDYYCQTCEAHLISMAELRDRSLRYDIPAHDILVEIMRSHQQIARYPASRYNPGVAPDDLAISEPIHRAPSQMRIAGVDLGSGEFRATTADMRALEDAPNGGLVRLEVDSPEFGTFTNVAPPSFSHITELTRIPNDAMLQSMRLSYAALRSERMSVTPNNSLDRLPSELIERYLNSRDRVTGPGFYPRTAVDPKPAITPTYPENATRRIIRKAKA